MKKDDICRAVAQAIEEFMPQASKYEGRDMLSDGEIDSFAVVELTIALGERLGKPLDPRLIVAENFATVEAITSMAISFWGDAE